MPHYRRHLIKSEIAAVVEALQTQSCAEVSRRTGHNVKTIYRIAKSLAQPAPPAPPQPQQPEPEPQERAGLRLYSVQEDHSADAPGATVTRYIITSAQNNTPIHDGLWANLLALADHYRARLIVGRYVYNLEALGQRGQEKDPNALSKRARLERWWAPQIMPYVLDERMRLAPDLEWCGHMNIMPTAVRPLGDLHNYTGTRSAIFPHPTLALESVPTGKHEPTKINYSTGAVTLPNYIQRKAGQKAEFHHALAALIVEVDQDGDWWVRQLNADHDGTICDLTIQVRDGRVTDRHTVEAINWGDIHVAEMQEWMEAACWGVNSIIDQLRPRYQLMHDTLDFRSRNHHDLKNPHVMFRKFTTRSESVEEELGQCCDFLHRASRQFCQTILVDSNHDNALTRWVRDTSHKNDPVNAIFYLRTELAIHEAIARGDDDFHVLEWALRQVGLKGDFRFLRTDESFVICDQNGNGIECGNHGHLGPNGSRGSDAGYVKMGRRMNIGHGHYALIWQGLYRAGVQANIDMQYAVGPSNWSQSLIVTYPTGKRAIVTFRNRKWRAAD